MPAGRPKKPVEQKLLEGTFRKDRDTQSAKTQLVLTQNSFLLQRKSIPCPAEITDEYVKKEWRKFAKRELSIHRLSEIDIPHMTQVFLVLQKSRRIYQRMLDAEAEDDEEAAERLEKRWLNLVGKYNDLAKQYDITPKARAQLTLDELGAVKAAQDISKGADGISAVLGMRK